jgi:hypothetical protein
MSDSLEMSARRIWMYWEDLPGSRRPAYLDLCLETIRDQAGSFDIQMAGRDSIFDLLPDLDPDVWNGLPNPVMRSDFARTRLVHRYGGLWLDADVIAMLPLDPLIAPLSTADVVGWGSELGGRFYNGLFAARPGADLIGRWVEEQDRTLRDARDWGRLAWGALGQDIMWPLGRRYGYHPLPIARIAPIPWYSWRRLISRIESPNRALIDEPWTVMLWHSAMAPRVAHLSPSDLAESTILLARLLRIALHRSSVEAESGGWARLGTLSSIRFSTNGRRLESGARRLMERGRDSRRRHDGAGARTDTPPG